MKGAVLSFACAAVLLTACAREPSVAQQGAASSTAERRVRIENFSLGTALGPNGGIAAGTDTNMFEMGQLLYVAMELVEAPLGTEIHVDWKAPSGEVLGQETKPVLRGQHFMNFAADSGNLPLGQNYLVEISMKGRVLRQLRFSLILSSA